MEWLKLGKHKFLHQFVMLSLLLLSLADLANAQGKCISLASSINCPEYAGKSFFKKEYSIEDFAGVQTIEQFDKYVTDNAAFNFGEICAKWPSAISTPIRYSVSTTCGFAVYSSTIRNVCNQNMPIPKNICKSSLVLTAGDVTAQLQEVLFNL
jgi:hypothetical protein